MMEERKRVMFKSDFAIYCYRSQNYYRLYRRLILKFPQAWKELHELGYDLVDKKITPAQMEVFRKYLG
jgi:hypothetical protein